MAEKVHKLRALLEKYAEDNEALVESALDAGIRAADVKSSFPYLQMLLHYVLGKPKETHEIQGDVTFKIQHVYADEGEKK